MKLSVRRYFTSPFRISPAARFSTIAVGNVDSLAENLGTTPGQLRPMLRKLVDQGYLMIEGTVAENLYPP